MTRRQTHASPALPGHPLGALAVVAPHPDDETLGCGGLIALAAAAGRRVVVVVMTGGTGSHPGSRRYPPARLAWLRKQEAAAALGVLSAQTIAPIALGLCDGALEQADAVATASLLASLFRLHDVRTVFSPRHDDTHPDHRATYRAARAAADALDAQLWCYPVWGEGDNDAEGPGVVRLDIASVLATKRRAVRRHRSQVSRLIRDSETAFRLSRADLARFETPWEVYFDDAVRRHPSSVTVEHS